VENYATYKGLTHILSQQPTHIQSSLESCIRFSHGSTPKSDHRQNSSKELHSKNSRLPKEQNTSD